jgi:hypothetical protein
MSVIMSVIHVIPHTTAERQRLQFEVMKVCLIMLSLQV